jgi:hypothetical protein
MSFLFPYKNGYLLHLASQENYEERCDSPSNNWYSMTKSTFSFVEETIELQPLKN